MILCQSGKTKSCAEIEHNIKLINLKGYKIKAHYKLSESTMKTGSHTADLVINK